MGKIVAWIVVGVVALAGFGLVGIIFEKAGTEIMILGGIVTCPGIFGPC